MRRLLAAAILLGLAAGLSPAGAAAPGDGVRIAVLDTGIDATHPELQGRIVERISFVEPAAAPVPGLPDPFANRPDPDGQGTAVASVAAGATLGTAPGAILSDLQVSARYTMTGLDPAREQAAIQAMDHLLRDHGGPGAAGARIALLSFADAPLSDEGASTLAAQAEGLWKAGVLVIAPTAPTPSAVHKSPFVLVVGDQDGDCRGGAVAPGTPIKPDMAALARNVQVAEPAPLPGAPGGTGSDSGTPLAAAAVAGAAARIWAEHPGIPVGAVAALLRDSAQDRGLAGPDLCTGFGALDVASAQAAAAAWTDPVVPSGTRSAPAVPAGAVGLLMLAAVRATSRKRAS